MNAVTLESVCFSYPKARARALDSVSLQIPQGSFFALLGENGAGKTTLMRLVCGRLLPTSGKIFFEDSLQRNGLADLKKFGTLIENPGDYPRLTVKEYLAFFGKLYSVDNVESRIVEVLEKLEFDFNLNSKVSTLSLGNRQKLQIARAVLHSPKVLLLDEPAANLDPMARESLWKALSCWRARENGTLIVCSHILPELDKFATHYAILKKGCVAMQGEVEPNSGYSVLQLENADVDRATQLLRNAGISLRVGEESLLTSLYKKAMKP